MDGTNDKARRRARILAWLSGSLLAISVPACKQAPETAPRAASSAAVDSGAAADAPAPAVTLNSGVMAMSSAAPVLELPPEQGAVTAAASSITRASYKKALSELDGKYR